MRNRKIWMLLLATSMVFTQLQGTGVTVKASQVKTKDKSQSFEKKLRALRNTAVGIQTKKRKASYKKGEVIAYFETQENFSKNAALWKNAQDVKVKNVWKFGKKKEKYKEVVYYASDSLSTKQLMNQVRENTDAKYVTPNYTYHALDLTNDTYSGQQWALQNNGQDGGTAGNDLAISKAWQDERYKKFVADDSKEAPVVAVIDTGMDFTNPDLKDVAWNNTHLATLQGRHGYDLINGDGDPQDDNGHGSHVSGIIAAAVNNNTGIAGENKKVKIMPVKCLDAMGGGTDSSLIGGYNYVYKAKKLGVNVVAVNNSWGGYGDVNQEAVYKKIIDAIGKEGVISVIAAGNNGEDLDVPSSNEYTDGMVAIPASVHSKYAITVAATDADGEVASYSNYGHKTVNIAAPGTDILSTVCYPCFNPTIYDNQKKQQVCDYYQGFDGTDIGVDQSQKYIEQPDIPGDSYHTGLSKGAKVDISVGKDQFGQNSGNALHVDMKNVKSGDSYVLAFPYVSKENEAKNMDSTYASALIKGTAQYDKEKNMYAYTVALYDATFNKDGSLLLSTVQGGDTMSADSKSGFVHFQYEQMTACKEGEKHALLVVVEAQCDFNAQLSIDDLAVSKAFDEDQAAEQFGKYDFYSGTSMAAPHVTGAVAMLKAIYPEKTPEQLRNTVCGLSKYSDLIGNKTENGSYLTYDSLDHFQPVINDMEKKDGKLCISGDYFGTEPGKAFVNDEQIPNEDLVWSDTSVQIKNLTCFNQNLKVSLQTKNGSTMKAGFIFSGEKKFTEHEASQELSHGGYSFEDPNDYAQNVFVGEAFNDDGSMSCIGKFCTNGTKLYYVKMDGTIYNYDFDNKVWVQESSFDTDLLEKDTSIASEMEGDDIVFISDPVYLNGSIYMILSCGKVYDRQYKLVSYDTNSSLGTWKVEKMPSDAALDNVVGYSLGSYDGKICLVGGYDLLDNKPVKSVYFYNTAKSTWSKGSDLPEGRYCASLCQSGDKLYAFLGGNEENTVPKACVYDGKSWKEIGESLDLTNATGAAISMSVDGKEHKYYMADISTAKDGIIISGITVNGLGDVFTLTKKADGTYSYQSTDYAWNDIINSGNDTAVSVGNTYYKIGTSEDGMAKLYTMPIQNTNLKVKDTSDTKKAVIEGAGEYLYGQTATLTAKSVNKNYVIKDFIVNGKKYKPGATVKVVMKKNITVKADVKKKILIKKITFSKKSVTVKAGKKLALKVKVAPSNAYSKKVAWSSSNVEYAAVSSKGVVTAAKAGKGKEVKITAKALDGSKKKAVCTIKIK